MDLFSLVRMLGALMVVLGALVCLLWAVKRYDLTMPRKWLEKLGNTGNDKRLQVVERLAVDQRRSLVLLRRDDTEFSVLIGPEGVTVLDSTAAPKAVEIVKQNYENQIFDKEPEAHIASFADRIPVLPDVWFTQDVKTELH
ncbi:Flagellar biogenesis protein precursor [Novosphingobium resinovorum]|uniref:Flagellar biogenesis protein n=1 Tax=Novosphingobium resinovorum TaxID=158500 RepID=A0A031JTE9_9SPHN|nr:flagellar biosynthetic protein FliO [Novosphingobium resinovorum]EZP80164.1 Flagellar biogenesis protein precursor [Novosphingobium resinovorum]